MHASTLPVGYVCTAWTALDETNSDNGALFYYPGSHHLPEVTPQDLTASLTEFNYREYEDHQQSLMQTLGYERREFHARPGDVMLFAGNIVHGGCPVADQDKTRRSVVTQYVFENCIYYTPRRSDLSAGALALRDPLIDICTGRRVKHTFNGRPVASYRLKSGLRRVQLDATLAQRALALVRDARYGFPQQKNRILRGRERKLRQATGKTVRLG
jgi:hypothetical protein